MQVYKKVHTEKKYLININEKKSGKRIKAEQVEKILKNASAFFHTMREKSTFFHALLFPTTDIKKNPFSFLTEKISPLFLCSFFYAFFFAVRCSCVHIICMCVWEQQAIKSIDVGGWVNDERLSETTKKLEQKRKSFIFLFFLHTQTRVDGPCKKSN